MSCHCCRSGWLPPLWEEDVLDAFPTFFFSHDELMNIRTRDFNLRPCRDVVVVGGLV